MNSLGFGARRTAGACKAGVCAPGTPRAHTLGSDVLQDSLRSAYLGSGAEEGGMSPKNPVAPKARKYVGTTGGLAGLWATDASQ